jgi:hypothetical protein
MGTGKGRAITRRDFLNGDQARLRARDPRSAGRHARARQKIGNVVIANSDAVWKPYAHSAIHEAWRAVGELG